MDKPKSTIDQCSVMLALMVLVAVLLRLPVHARVRSVSRRKALKIGVQAHLLG